MLYMILEHDNGVMDGELMSKDAMLKALVFADRDARVFAFDVEEARRDLATSLRDVTEDSISDAYMAGFLEEDSEISRGVDARKYAKRRAA